MNNLIRKVYQTQDKYATYLNLTRSHQEIHTNSYAQAVNGFVKDNSGMINNFIERMLAFYRTKKLPYNEIIVYVFPVENARINKTFAFHNTILLSATDQAQAYMKDGLGIVLHEIVHMVYENQAIALQYSMEKFFA